MKWDPTKPSKRFALRGEEDELRALLENVPIGIYRNTPGPQGKFLAANPAFFDMFGFESEEELAEVTVADLYADPSERKRFSENLLDKERVTGVELHLKKRDESRLWGSVTAQVVRGKSGEVICFDCTIEDITERKRLEREAEERRLYLESLLKSAPDAIITLGKEHRVLEWNPGAEKLFGYSAEEARGNELDELVTMSDAAMMEQARDFTEQVVAGGTIPPMETVRYRKDGTLVHVILSGAPIQVGGEIIGAIVAYTDITARKRAEKELDFRRKLWDSLMDNTPDLVYFKDKNHRMIRASQAYADIFGVDAEELTGKTAVELWPEGEEIMADERQVLAGERMIKKERKVTTPQGETQWYLLTKIPIYEEKAPSGVGAAQEREVIGFFAIDKDITERKRAEEKLRKRTEQLEALRKVGLELASELNVDELLRSIVSCAVKLADASAGGFDLYNEEQDVLNFTIHVGYGNLPHEISIQPGEGLAGKVWETGETIIVDDYTAWSGRADAWVDRLSHFAAIGIPIRWGGQLLGVLEVVADPPRKFCQEDAELLELFASQAAIAIENARLYERAQREIADRAQVEKALRQYATELEARNEELDAFAHTVAHDLKNPLARIIGFAQVLEEEYLTLSDSELRRYLSIIVRDGYRANRIVDDLLLLASVRQEEVELAPLNMAEIVEEALEQLAHDIEEAQAEIILPEKWPVVLGHRLWIEEVWFNYINNAIKYGGRPEESTPPRVELGSDDYIDTQVRFWVRDNGLGLAPEEQELLFTPFTQLEHISSSGHGLGLSIVRRIVEKLGGRVSVESEIGRGSLFSFTLPKPAANASARPDELG